MKNRIKKFAKKQWLLLWIFAAMCGLFWMMASAESMKTLTPLERVVVSKEGHGTLFSSNLLMEDGDTKYQPLYKTQLVNRTYDTEISLWNYNILDATTYYGEPINYEIQAKFVDTSGNDLTAAAVSGRSVQIIADNNESKSITLSSSKLSDTIEDLILPYYSNRGTETNFTVKFSSNWNLENDTNICVLVRAVPTEDQGGQAYTDIFPISRILGLKTSGGSVSRGWTAALDEYNKAPTSSPTDYDAYNLVMSGSGAATIEIKWDPSKVELNRYFYNGSHQVYGFASGEVVDESTDSDGWHTIKVYADTSSSAKNNRNRYSVQIYKLGELDDSENPDDWDFVAYDSTVSDSPDAWVIVNISQ